LTGDASAATERKARKTNIKQPAVHFMGAAHPTSWKLVFIIHATESLCDC
jgi:hypothetical protein